MHGLPSSMALAGVMGLGNNDQAKWRALVFGGNMVDLINDLGGPYGFGTGTLASNDDGSTGAIDITPAFANGINLFGTIYNQIYINNNGNITFDGTLSAYTPEAIGSGYTAPIIAPFWADVYTENGPDTPTGGGSAGTNEVWYDVDAASHSVIITWDDVGYYQSDSKENAFQLILSQTANGAAAITFRYQTIQWTTGDASGGTGGLGGTPARIGYSAGNGINYYEIPASTNQAALLALPSTPGNTGLAGIYQFLSTAAGIFSYAQPVVTPGTLAFGHVHVGATATAAVTIANTALAPAEDLDAGFATSNTTLEMTSGTIALLAPGNTNSTSLSVTLNSAAAGSKDGSVVLDLASDGTGSSGEGQTTLAAQTIQVTGTAYAYADPIVSTAALSLGAARLGGSLAGTLSLADGTSLTPYQESLLYTLSTAPAGYRVTGGAGTILAGGTGLIGIALTPGAAGSFAGQATLALTSTGTGTSGLADTALAPATIALTGDIYAAATASLSGTQFNFGIIHTSDVLDGTLTLANLGAGALADALLLSNSTLTGDVTGVTLADGMVSAGGTGLLDFAINSTNAGTSAGKAVLDFASHDDELTDARAGSATVSVSGTIDHYATAGLSIAHGAGTLAGGGGSYELNLGTLAFGAAAASVTLALSNLATGTADQLDGSFNLSGSSPFTESGFTGLSGLTAGQAGMAGAVTLGTGTLGTFNETIILDATGTNASGYHGTLVAQTLAVTGAVLGPPPTLTAPAAVLLGYDEQDVIPGLTLTVPDVAAGEPFTITAQDQTGALFANGTGVSGADSNDLTLTGTLADINLALSSLSGRTGAADAITLTVADGFGQSGTPATIAVSLHAVPELSWPGAITVTQSFGSTLAGLALHEQGAAPAGTYQVTLADQNGLLSSPAAIAGTGSQTLVLAGDLAAINAALAGISLTETGTAADALTLTARDPAGYAAAAGTIAISIVPDRPELLVSGIVSPGTAIAGQVVPVSWTLANDGTSLASGPWSDEVIEYADAQGDSPTVLGTFDYVGTLAVGETIIRNAAVTLAASLSGTAWIGVRTDAFDQVPENVSDTTKTAIGTAPVTVAAAAQAALAVTSIAAPTVAGSGQQTQISWIVTNNGNAATSAGYWNDKVYLSLDRTLDTSDLLLATVQNPSYLATGQSYESQATVTLPQGISGPYYIIVYTDAGAVSGPHGGDVVIPSQVGVSAPFPVTLSPVANLQVTSIHTASQDFSGQSAVLSWTVANQGSAATDAGQWYDQVYLSTDGSLDSSAILLDTEYHDGTLSAGASYSASATVNLPIGLSGTAALFVVSDAGSEVYEIGGSLAHAGSVAVQINLTPPPDLEATLGALPAGTVTSHELHVSYLVANAGASATPNTYWTDNVYLSAAPTLDSSATLLGEINHAGALDTGAFYSVSSDFALPDSLSGAYYLIVDADADNAVFELDHTGKIAASSTALQIDFSPVDLTAGGVTLPSRAAAGSAILVRWTVTNTGSGDTANNSWTDQLILSPSGTLGSAGNITLGSYGNPGALAAGASYTQQASVDLPNTLAGGYTLFVVTDGGKTLAESSYADNASAGQSLAVAALPSLTVAAVQGPQTDHSGDTLSLAWTVANGSSVAVTAAQWDDSIYLTTGPDFSGGELFLGDVAHRGTLAAGGSYTASGTFALPAQLASGSYYLAVETDSQHQVAQASTQGDLGFSSPDLITYVPVTIQTGGTTSASSGTLTPVLGIPVVQPASTLTASGVTASPGTVFSGQDLTVDWTLADAGANASGWYDEIYISHDQVLDLATATPLGSVYEAGSLASGTDGTYSAAFLVPAGLSGTYYAYVVADASDRLNEPSSGANTAASQGFAVALPSPVSLSVDAVSIGLDGSTATVSYIVDNAGDTPSGDSWEDAVYLSSTGTWSVSDPLLGYVEHGGGVPANGTYSETFNATLPGLVPGEYFAIVKTNVRDTEPNANQVNNSGTSASGVTVGLPVLTLGTPASGTLSTDGTSYYEFTAAAGQTVDLKLTGGTGTANDLYVSYGTLPTIGQFDVTSIVPESQNPEAIIPETQAGTYYVMLRESGGPQEAYTLSSSAVGFSVTGITPDEGSNLGSVTLTLSGAHFDANANVTLVAPDGTVLTAKKTTWVNSGQLWATFDLQGAAIGGYSVKVTDNGQDASLADGFQVTNGPAGQLAVSLIAPAQLHTHNSPDGLNGTQNGIVTVQYTNTGQTDIDTPILNLQAQNAAFQAGVTGLISATQISILGTNQTGPAGILQPGAQETVSYTFAGNFGYAQFITMQLSLGTLEGSSQTVDWSSLAAVAQPATIDDTDWALIWQRFEQQVGGTTQSLLDALSQAATSLSQIGESTPDLGTLLSYELQQATGALPAITLVDATDLADPGTGLDLSLGRSDDASLLNRNQAGAFGLGWGFTYGIKAVTDTAGNVYIESPTGDESFTLNSDGSYSAPAGDESRLTLTGGAYTLTALNGTVETFRPDGQISTISDANGNEVTVSYTSAGVISGVTSSNGQSLAFTTNAEGDITSAKDGNGQTVTYTYDSSGQHLLSVTGAGGTTHYRYAGTANAFTANALTGVTNPDGTAETFTYNSSGSLASQSGTNGSGAVSYSYGGPGEVTLTDANGNALKELYDSAGNLKEIQDAAGNVTQLGYDAAGNLTGVTGADGSQSSFTYDANGDLTGYTDAAGNTVKAAYNASGQMTSFTDQDGNTTQYLYDPSGNLAGITYDDGTGTSYAYNSAGALTSSTDARGQTTAYSYNAQGLLTKEGFADGTSQSYAYNAQGELTAATATSGGTTAYAYNAAGLLTSVTDPSGRVESYGYNSAGQEIQRVEPDGSITNYSYTAAGQLAELTDGNGTLLVKYSYDTAGQLTGAAMGNGATTAYTYDHLGNVSSIITKDAAGAITSSLSYTYDSSSRPVTETSLDGAWRYSYNSDGELTGAVFASTNASVPNQNLTYAYDAAGNRTQTIFNGATNNYTTNGLNQYTAADGTTYGYDADGNLITTTQNGETTTYAYNALNQMVSSTDASGTTSYQYDALGNRVAQTVNGVTTSYVYDPLAIDTAATGPLSAIAQVYNAAGTATATYDYGNGLAAMNSGGQTYYYNADANGNITGLSGGGGTLADSYDYSPFGSVIYSLGSVANSFRFSGQNGDYTLPDGLINMRARVYSPASGSFLSQDPLGVVGGANEYIYGANNPMIYIDPAGDWEINGGQLFKGLAGLGTGIGSALAVGGVAATAADLGLVLGTTAFFLGASPFIVGAIAVGAAGTAALAVGGLIGYGIGEGVTDLYDSISNQNPNEVSVEPGEWQDYFAGLASVALSVGKPFESLAKIPKDWFPDLTSPFADKLTETLLNQLAKLMGNSTTNVAATHSVDPNDIIGPAGYGTQKFIAKTGLDAYTINFQNTTTATAPAQQIVITQQLDANLDWRTFRLTGFGFDNQTTTLSGNQAFYSALLDYSATKGFDVQVTAGVNVETGLVTWTFQTIDPATGQAPTNPQLGLLPPDDPAGDGEGFVSYTIAPKSTVQTGDSVSAQATVIFDTNAPITTPTISNEIDATAPTSVVTALPATEEADSFLVSWSGTDDAAGSGIASYTIYVAEDGGTPTAWLQNTTRTNAIFTGTAGHSYAFTATATDNAGNTETMHATADTVTEILCYLPGTHILTEQGMRLVEDLRRGDLVVTRFGGIRAVTWIGRQSYAPQFLSRARMPVRIAAGALGENLPLAPLCVSPGHSMLIEDTLILAKNLVNGITITQEETTETVDYYAVELEEHDCLLANCSWSESFADGPGLRNQFHNRAEFFELFPAYAEPQTLALCAPRPEAGPALEAALRPLIAGLHVTHGALHGYIEVTGPDQVSGWAWDEANPDLPVLVEILADGAVIGTALACHYRGDLAAAGLGRGHCMFSAVLSIKQHPVITVRRAVDGAELPRSYACRFAA